MKIIKDNNLKWFWKEFCKKLCKKRNFIFKVILYWTVWNALSQTHWATVSLNYSKSIKINIGPSDGGTIVPSAHHHIVFYWRLSDFISRALVIAFYCWLTSDPNSTIGGILTISVHVPSKFYIDCHIDQVNALW